MQRLMKSTPVFLVLYLLFMIPTYILPYFGSNSSVATLLGGAVGGLGGMFPPQWWFHMLILAVLVVLAWARGSVIVGKAYLPMLALLAAIFDMTPVLRAIPLVPTGLHVTTLVLGTMGSIMAETPSRAGSFWRRPEGVLAGLTTIALAGCTWSIISINQWHKATSKGFESAMTKQKQVVAKAPAYVPPPAPVPAKKEPEVAPAAPATTVPVPPPAPVSQPEPVATAPVPATPPAPVAHAPAPPTSTAPAKAPEKVASVQKAAPPAHDSAVADFVSEGRSCLNAKRYECAISQAKAALRLAPGNNPAKALLDKAIAGQRAALDSIEIK